MLDFCLKQANGLNYIKLDKIRTYLERSESIKKFAKLILNSSFDIIEFYRNAMSFKNTVRYLVSKFKDLSLNKNDRTILSVSLLKKKNRAFTKNYEEITCGLP